MNEDIKKNSRKISIIQTIDSYDKRLSEKIHTLELSSLLENFVYLNARLFNPDFITFYILTMLLYKYYFFDDFYFFLKPLFHTGFCLIVTLLLKKIFGRPRPNYYQNVKRLYDLRKHEKNYSMPSGDSLQSANFSIILHYYFESYIGFYILPFVMFSRVFFFCHYIYDTIVGAILGLVISNCVYLYLNHQF